MGKLPFLGQITPFTDMIGLSEPIVQSQKLPTNGVLLHRRICHGCGTEVSYSRIHISQIYFIYVLIIPNNNKYK